MASNIQPTGLDWKNLPDKTTPISAENLNKMANTIDDLVEAVNPLNTVEANPTGTPTEGLEKVEIDGTLYEVKGGHKILNDSGTTLAQKDNLQFKGVYTQNNGDNTEVDICRTMTKAQMEALSGEALKGFINTSDEPDSLPLTAEWVGYGNGSVKDGLDNKVSKTGDTMTGDLTINRNNGTTSSVGESVLALGNNISQGTAGNSKGLIRFFDNLNHKAILAPSNNMTADRFITLPDKGGTIGVEEKYTNISMTNSVGGAETSKAILYATGNVGFLDFKFTCQSVTNETITFDLPSGWRIQNGAIGLRDNDNGNLITGWGSPYTISTYRHTGTTTVGNSIWGFAMCYKV